MSPLTPHTPAKLWLCVYPIESFARPKFQFLQITQDAPDKVTMTVLYYKEWVDEIYLFEDSIIYKLDTWK